MVTARSGKITAAALLVLVLATPSIWLLATVPPLWRDIDAYLQMTERFGPTTVLLHGPLYSFAARLPLYLGYLIDNGGEMKSLAAFLPRPTLTDSGVLALLLVQHAGLLAAHSFFVTSVSHVGWVRLCAAAALAVNPLLYTFAHCVGSESLSGIGTIVLVTLGLRIVRRRDVLRANEWITYGIACVLLMLTRHINAALVALLPLALLPLLYRNTRSSGLRRLVLAVALGIACVAFTAGCMRLIAFAADTPYRSKLGFTFLWRLKFLQNVPAGERGRVIAAAAQRARSPETKAIIEAMNELFSPSGQLELGEFVKRRRDELFPPGTSAAAERLDHALNGLPPAFALAAAPALMRAAAADFARARRTRISDVTDFLFSSTAYYFGREEQLPGLAKLVTFRGPGEQLIMTARHQPYFWWWGRVTCNDWLLAWLAAFAGVLAIARVRVVETVATCSYATALVLTGLLMMLANCFLSELLPRYTLPMLELTFLSLVILVARLAEIATMKGVGEPESRS